MTRRAGAGARPSAFGLLALAAFCGLSIPAQAASSNATVLARATLVRSLAVVSQAPLSFGVIAPAGGQSSTVRVSPTGEVTSFPPVTATLAGEPARPAPFLVTGQPGMAYQVETPVSAVLTGSGASMTVNGFVYAFEGSGSTGGVGRLDGSGSQTLNMGATLTVGADQAPGFYVGSYAVTVRYQ